MSLLLLIAMMRPSLADLIAFIIEIIFVSCGIRFLLLQAEASGLADM
jgi:hypothetical protein